MDNMIPEMNIRYTTTIEWLNKDKKGTRNRRKIFKQESPKQLISQVKWVNELALNEKTDWQLL